MSILRSSHCIVIIFLFSLAAIEINIYIYIYVYICYCFSSYVVSNCSFILVDDFDGAPGGSVLKTRPATQETQVRSLGREDSPGEGNGIRLQYSCLEKPMDRGAWRAVVHRVTKSQTQLSY